MTTPLRVDGVDISHWQSSTLDMAAAKRAGVQFVYHKATEGSTITDARYSARRIEAAKAGLRFGAYHFASPEGGDALAEAKHFLAVARPAPGDMIPALDLEVNPGKLSRSALTTWVKTFVGEVVRQVGVKPIIYTPFDLDGTAGCALWVARYSNANAAPSIPAPWKLADVWIRQFSDGQYGVPKSVEGFGSVDLNHLPKGRASVNCLTILADPLPPVEPVTPKPPASPERAPRNIRLGTINLHADLVKRNPRAAAQIIIDAFEKRDVDALAVQEYGEMYDKRKGFDRTGHEMVRAANLRVFNGHGKAGQGATPVVVRPGIPYHHVWSLPLLPRIFMGEGAGPDWLKAKWLNVVLLEFNHRTIPFASIHGVPSVQYKLRRALALRFFNKAAQHLSRFGMAAVGGDFNVKPNDGVLAKMRKAMSGMRSASAQANIQVTHEGTRRPIDDIMYDHLPDHWKWIKTETFDTASDHHLLVAEFEVYPRPLAGTMGI